MLRVTLKNAKSSSQRGLKRYSFDYSTSKDTMRAYNGDKYLEQWKKNPGKTFEGKWEAFIQPKLDGVRCLFTAKGAFSRTGKQFMNLWHIEVLLESFFAANPNAVLDGELYNHELKDDFEKIISLFLSMLDWPIRYDPNGYV